MGDILVSHGSATATASDPDMITFGRAADLVIGEDNRRMHRVVGRFVGTASSWSVENHASAYHLTVSSSDSGWSTTVCPGAAAVLPAGCGLVAVDLGDIRYAINFELTSNETYPVAPSQSADPTIDAPPMKLRFEQRVLLVALAEPALRQPGLWPPPSPPANKEVASRLGWKITKFNRKLDYLCGRVARLGVDGLLGDSALLATDRRRILIQWAISTGAIRLTDLALLDGPHIAGANRTETR